MDPSTSLPDAVPTVGTTTHIPNSDTVDIASPIPSPSSSIGSLEDDSRGRLQRPKLPSRKSSGTMIIPRDSPRVELGEEEEYDADDVRAMSPKRSMETIDKLGEDARAHLMAQARMLQASLMAIVDRVETVKSEHEKLEGGNKFLQSYIGELIQTSKITSSKPRGKGRSTK